MLKAAHPKICNNKKEFFYEWWNGRCRQQLTKNEKMKNRIENERKFWDSYVKKDDENRTIVLV